MSAAAGGHGTEDDLRRLGEGSPDILWIREAPSLRWAYLSPAFEAVCGLPREAALAGDHVDAWLALVVPEDRDGVRGALEAAARGERPRTDLRVRRPVDGALRWLREAAFPLPDAAGRIDRIGGTIHDVTDLKGAEAAQRRLLADVQHRLRNTLAVIRSLVRRSAATSATVESFATHLEGRIAAFARIQSAAARSPDASLDLEMILRDELRAAAVGDDRARIEGPPVRLPDRIAQALALAFHELVTNAIKHGALTRPRGRIEVGWQVDRAGSAPVLRLAWTERAGPPLAPPRHRGFGTELLERTLAYNVGATTNLDYRPSGLDCRIDVPLAPPPGA